MIDLLSDNNGNEVDLLSTNTPAKVPSDYSLGQKGLAVTFVTGSPDTAKSIVDEFLYTGGSSAYKELALSLQEEQNSNVIEALKDDSLYSNPELLSESVAAGQMIIGQSSLSDSTLLKKAALGKIATAGMNPAAVLDSVDYEKDMTTLAFSPTGIEAALQYSDVVSKAEQQISGMITESNSVANIIEILAPFSDWVARYLGDVADGDASFFTSSYINGVKDRLNQLPFDERAAAVNGLVETFKKFSEDNELVLNSGQILLSVLNPNYNEEWTGALLDDVANVLDAVGVGFLGRAAIKTFRGVPQVVEVKYNPSSTDAGDTTLESSMGNLANKVNPEIGRQLTIAGLQDSKVAAATFGAKSTADLYRSKVIPKYDENGVSSVFDNTSSIFGKQEMRSQTLMEDILRGANTSGAQLTEAEQQAQRAYTLERLEAESIHIREATTTLSKEEDGYHVYASYGKTATSGFRTSQQALQETLEATAHLGVDVEDLTLMTKLDNGKIVPVSLEDAAKIERNLKENEFFVNVNFKKSWGVDNLSGLKDIEEAVDKTLSAKIGSASSYLGKAADYLINNANREQKLITRTINLLQDRSSFVTGGLTELARPFSQMGASDKFQAVRFLRKGDAEGKRYSTRELEQFVKNGELTETAAKGIQANYRFWDTVYLLDNRSFAKQLANEGYHIARIRHGDDTQSTLVGRPMSFKDLGKDEAVLDLESDSVVRATEASKLFHLKSPVKAADGSYYTKVILPTDTSRIRAIRESDAVLEYRAGYFPRKYRGDYYVDRVTKLANGETVVKAVANFESIAEAQKYAAAKGVSDGVSYTARASKELQRSRNVDAEDGFAASLFIEEDMGRSIQRYRGQRLAGDVMDETVVAPTLDPIETMLNSAFNSGRMALHLETIGTLEARFKREFGDMFDSRTGYPSSKPEFRGDEARKIRATSLYNYIETQKQLVDDYATKRFLKAALSFSADALSVAGLETIAKGLRLASNTDPVKFIRSAAFQAYMVGHPTRQALLQTAGLLTVIPLTLKYANPVRLFGDIITLKRMFSTSIADADMQKQYAIAAKSMGITEQDAKVLLENFRQSGIPFSVDANSLVDGLQRSFGGEVYDSLAKTKASAAFQATLSPLRFAKKIGFDWGEFNNLAGTYLVAAERYKGTKSYSELTKRDWAKIQDSARVLSLSMTRPDNFAYQQGLLSLPMQFTQAFHKYGLMITLGSKELTPAERARIVAVNSLLWTGMFTAVWEGGLQDIMQDAPDAVKETVHRGLMNYALNSSIEAGYKVLSGEEIESKVDIGSIYMQGISQMASEKLTQLFSGEHWDMIAGWKAVKTGIDGIDRAVSIIHGDFGFDLSTPERLSKAFLSAGSFYAGLNSANKAFVGQAFSRGAILNSKMQEMVEANGVEVFMNSVFGIPTTELTDYYAMMSKNSTAYTKPDHKEIADKVYSLFVQVSSGKEPEEKLAGVQAMLQMVNEEYPEDATLIYKELMKSLNKTDGGTVNSSLWTILTSQNIPNDVRCNATQFVKNHPNFNQNATFVVQGLIGNGTCE